MKYLIIFLLLFVISCGEETNNIKEKETETECSEGYVLDVDTNLCVLIEIDPCENYECQENATCIVGVDAPIYPNNDDAPASPQCICNYGYTLDSNTNLCVLPNLEKTKLRFTAANLTSGDDQAYEEEGIRILKALKSDVIMIQEFNYKTNSKADIDDFVKNTFGENYQYFRGTPTGNGDIPNGIISRYPIIGFGELTDPRVTDRKIDYAEINVNTDIKLLVFSVHLKGQEDDSQIIAAQIIAKKISEHKKLNSNYYYIVGGDFNGEASVSNSGFGTYNNEDILMVNSDYPKSEYGDDGNTNRTRTARLDFILVDNNLYDYQISTDYCINETECKKYPDGLVFDSRNYSNSDLTTYFAPVLSNDSDAKNMQHLAVVKDFLIGEKEVVKKEILTEEEFNSIFKNPLASGKSGACPGYDFYNYNDFINAVHEYPKFGNEGTEEIRKREIAAFLANISHETTGGWSTAPGGRYLWGLCWIEEIACTDTICTQYCQEGNVEYPCASGKTYHGRGPIQLTWNYNYGAVGDKIGIDLLSNPELVSTDASISFRTALWFWNTPQSPKPSSHDVMVENWIPTSDDLAKNRDIGFGMTVNIINGGAECGKIDDSRVNDRVEHFKFFCDLLNTTTGDNLYCDDMVHFK